MERIRGNTGLPRFASQSIPETECEFHTTGVKEVVEPFRIRAPIGVTERDVFDGRWENPHRQTHLLWEYGLAEKKGTYWLGIRSEVNQWLLARNRSRNELPP